MFQFFDGPPPFYSCWSSQSRFFRLEESDNTQWLFFIALHSWWCSFLVPGALQNPTSQPLTPPGVLQTLKASDCYWLLANSGLLTRCYSKANQFLTLYCLPGALQSQTTSVCDSYLWSYCQLLFKVWQGPNFELSTLQWPSVMYH